MNEIFENENVEVENDYITEIIQLINDCSDDKELSIALDDYHDNDIAKAYEQLDSKYRKRLYNVLGVERFSDIFTYVENPEDFIENISAKHVAKIIDEMDADDAIDILENLDDDKQEEITKFLSPETKEDIELLQSYEDDEIGSKMTTNFILINKNLSIPKAMDELIKQSEDNDNVSTIYTFDEDNKFYGAIDLKDLIITRKNGQLDSIISTSFPYVYDKDKVKDVLEKIKDYAEDSIPVLNDKDEFLGIITSQDIIEIVDDEMGDDYAKLAGLTAEEDLKETLFQSMKKRLPWLIALLVLGIGVSTVVGIFETVVASIALIVCFQSLILDMAGNAGTQSLAVTIRVLMDENLKTKEKVKLIFKEVRVGFCNGLLLGILSFIFVGLYLFLLKGQVPMYAFGISGCVGVALTLAMTVSSFVGTIIPMFFHKIGVDPAVASGPLITTINDLVAVVTYYGLAWILLINVFHFY